VPVSLESTAVKVESQDALDCERRPKAHPKATNSELKELWAKVANESLERTGDEGRAVREANAVVARQAQSA
jgi:hypothetical protein